MWIGLTAGITIEFSSIWDFVASVIFVVAMAAVSQRLLGVRISRWKVGIASVLGTLIGIGATAVLPRSPGSAAVAGVIVLVGVLSTMTLMVVFQFLWTKGRQEPRRRSRRDLVHPVRWVRRKLAPIGRTRQVVHYARRRGLVRPRYVSMAGITTAEFGLRLRLTLEDAGGMFIKFGQIASTRSDLLSEPVVAELGQLRASVRPIPPDQLRPLIEAEIDREVEDAFTTFEWEPLAAASIGQTHRAVLQTGEQVVVKIQRPGMDDLLRRDATVLRLVTSLAERRIDGARRMGIRALAEELIRGLERELDYRREASMSRRLRAELPLDGNVRIPAVYEELSTERLLVMEQAVARSVGDGAEVVQSSVPSDELARRLLRSFLRQVLSGGAYHADPHPGNVLIDQSGSLWLLDFGAVGLLDPVSRELLQEMALGMSIGEPLIVARALRRLTGSEASADLRLLEADVGSLMVETGGGFDPRVIQDVLTMMSRYGLGVPPSMTQLSRALLTLDGTLRLMAPGFDLTSEATALVRELTSVSDQPSADLLQGEVLRALPILRDLPEHADELATQLRSGRFSVRVERFKGEEARTVERWIDRIVVAVIACGGAVAASLLLLAAGLTHAGDISDLLRGIGFAGLVFAFVLLVRTVAQALAREERSR